MKIQIIYHMNVVKEGTKRAYNPITSFRVPHDLDKLIEEEAYTSRKTKSDVIIHHLRNSFTKPSKKLDMDVFKHISCEDFVYNCLIVFGIDRDELRQSPAACEQFCKTIHPVMFRLIGYGSTYEAVNIPLQNVLNGDYTSSVDVADNLYRYMVDYATNIYQREIGVLQALRDQYNNTINISLKN